MIRPRQIKWLILLLSVAVPAFAGPKDVWEPEAEKVGELKLDHVLKEVAPPVDYVPPPPPEDDGGEFEEGKIFISEPSTPLNRLGIYKPKDVSLDANTWKYLTEKEALDKVAKLPDAPLSGMLAQTLNHLLLIEADAPRGLKKNWLTTRTLALLQLGNVSQALALLEQVPESYFDVSFRPFFAYVALLNGKKELACDTMKDQPRSDDAPYRRLEIFCDVVSKQANKADLALTLLEENGTPAPEWFKLLIESMRYSDVVIKSPEKIDESLDLAMLLSAGNRSVSKHLDFKAYLGDEHKHLHYLIAQNTNFQYRWRIPFAESAAITDPKAKMLLKELYAHANPETSGKAITRISAYQLMLRKPSVPHVANTHKLAAQFVTPATIDVLLGAQLKELSRKLPHHPSYQAFSAKAYGILARNGNIDETAAWLAIMDRFQPNDVYTFIGYELKRFYTDHAKALSPSAMRLPMAAANFSDDEHAKAMLKRFYSLMPLFGYLLPEGLADELKEKDDISSDEKDAIQEIAEMGERGSVAGVILATLQASQGKPLKDVNTAVIYAAVNALKLAGKDKLAKQLMLESMLSWYQ
ncbi:MAG: hypothetical protein MRY32_07130 [Rickettsiales bacterium]|nr:hypothetical protein [Rickettsiales bacterium]